MSRAVTWLELPKDPHIGRSDKLVYGDILTLAHQVYPQSPEPELIAMDEEQLMQRMEKSKDAEERIAAELAQAIKKWEDQAVITQKIQGALSYIRTPEIEHTANEWQKASYRNDTEQISNRVYKMSCTLYGNTTWSKAAQNYREVFYASWYVGLNVPSYNYRGIAGQRDKRFDTEEAAVKYLEGRKKAYAHLFQELSPPIPQEYAECFKVSGCLLPGYRIEGQEQQHAQEQLKQPQQSYTLNLNGQSVAIQAGSPQEAAEKALAQLDAQAQSPAQSPAQQPQQAPAGPKLTM